MDDEFKFVLKCVLTGFMTLVLAGSSCQIHETHKKAELIRNGADPIEVACSFGDVSKCPYVRQK